MVFWVSRGDHEVTAQEIADALDNGSISGLLPLQGGLIVKVTVTGSSISPLTDSHYYIVSTNTSGTLTFRCPRADAEAGRVFEFYKLGSGGQHIILPASGSGDTFDGAGSITVSTQYQYVRIVSDGISNWMISN